MIRVTSYKEFMVLLFGAVSVWYSELLNSEERPVILPAGWVNDVYDFIIIGGGSAGCVLANRLSENRHWKVLLLEAGGDETLETEAPLLMYNLWNTPFDWNYTTVYQERACGFQGGKCSWPRGRVLGGSSSINGVVYIRGNRKDYDNWAAQGNQGWSYEEVLPYFLRSEDMKEQKYSLDGRYHSTGGYLTVSESNYQGQLVSDYMEIGRQMGFEVRDVNGERQTGFMPLQGTFRDGARCSAAKAFLRPARNRPNLHVVTDALVTRIVIDERTLTATGVEFRKDGTDMVVEATKEVILSAGAINSPQLLMLSGIGPREHLAEMGIPLIRDLPVGENLQDHIGVLLVFKVDPSIEIKPYWNFHAIKEFVAFKKGPISSSVIDAVAFLHSRYSNDPDYPDVQIHFANPPQIAWGEKHLLGIFSQLLRPRSSGTIRLQSADPRVPPEVDPNYFADPKDFLLVKDAARIALTISESNVMEKYNVSLDMKYHELCRHVQYYADDFLGCLASNYSSTVFHPTSTCRMGPANDRRSVVDPTLKVIGVDHLRVIDASVMPDVISGNTNAPTIMIAEKGSDLIKHSWRGY